MTTLTRTYMCNFIF